MNAIKGHHVHHHPNHIGGNVHEERGIGPKTGKHKLTIITDTDVFERLSVDQL